MGFRERSSRRVRAAVAAVALGVVGVCTVPTSSVHAQATCNPGGGNRKATATFVNNSSVNVQIFWVDYDCVERPYHTLAPGARYKQPTFVTQLWRVRDTDGRLVGEVRIRPRKSGRAPAPTITIS